MKKRLWLLVALLLLALVPLIPLVARAADSKPAPAPASSSTTPGVALAQGVSTVTGVAISPLLGISAVGAWQWWQAKTDEQKARLPWFAQPWFWLCGLGLVGAVAAKDVLGAATPPGLKKPLDVAETLENKVSGLAAAGALLPMLMAIFAAVKSADGGPGFSEMGFAAIDGSTVVSVLLLPFALIAYAAVWLAAHVINVLILLSPWGGIDAALKLARTFLLTTVAVAAWADPWVGVLISGLVILFAWLISGWAFRMMIFGWVFCWDTLTFRKKLFRPDASGNPAFAARRIGDTPVRSYGRLTREDSGKLVFTYKPFLVMAERHIEVPPGRYAVGNALFYPSLEAVEGEETKTLFNFPPRCNSHETELAKLYHCEVRDVGLIKGFKDAWRWLRELFGFGGAVAVPEASAG
jgi:hypothetical protein